MHTENFTIEKMILPGFMVRICYMQVSAVSSMHRMSAVNSALRSNHFVSPIFRSSCSRSNLFITVDSIHCHSYGNFLFVSN